MARVATRIRKLGERGECFFCAVHAQAVVWTQIFRRFFTSTMRGEGRCGIEKILVGVRIRTSGLYVVADALASTDPPAIRLVKVLVLCYFALFITFCLLVERTSCAVGRLRKTDCNRIARRKRFRQGFIKNVFQMLRLGTILLKYWSAAMVVFFFSGA